VAVNDPFAGGTHLPDVTLVMGVFGEAAGSRRQTAGKKKRAPAARPLRPASCLFYVANRAHHADIGGATPGSMGVATDVYGEGVRIPPIRMMRGGEICEDVMKLILANVRGSDERRADFEAQIGSLKTGEMRLLEIVERRGNEPAREYAQHLISYSSRMMRATLAEIPDGTYEAEDALDDDGIGNKEVPIRVRITIKGEHAIVNFTGSAPQVAGAVNAVEAITFSAVSYCFRCLIGSEVPASAGLIEPIEVLAPKGTVVNALPPSSVAGGNVETSQRIVDVVFKALSQAIPDRIPAASQGTMNNLTIGGLDPRTGREFSYYETVAGGMGARPTLGGMNATHTHMTNSLNTPAEALEYAYPLRVREYRIRRDSGGKGRHKGGDGAIREIETLTPSRVALPSDRRTLAPYGLNGGGDGKRGRAFLIRRDGRREELTSKGSWQVEAGDRVRIETPGGGGYGE
jgi:N-methylhydantoinase B